MMPKTERNRLRFAFQVMVDAPDPNVVWLLGIARAALVERADEIAEAEYQSGRADQLAREAIGQAAIAADLRERLAEARLRETALTAALREIFAAYENDAWVPEVAENDAPGHAHSEPGKWDDSGDVCRWCAAWNTARGVSE